jgi:ribosomal protein S18 acetylase RimI-like enzyme
MEDCRIRAAAAADVPAAARIYDELHDAEEAGEAVIGWIRGVYPTAAVAEAALARGDLYVLEAGGDILGAAIVNRIQVDCYAGAPWEHEAAEDGALVLHTLVISPRAGGRGYGPAFVRFYEDCARAQGLRELRLDTNARNARARAMYAKLGYREIGSVPTTFNGIPGVELVLLEKYLEEDA